MSDPDFQSFSNRLVRFVALCDELGVSNITLRRLAQELLEISDCCMEIGHRDLKRWLDRQSIMGRQPASPPERAQTLPVPQANVMAGGDPTNTHSPSNRVVRFAVACREAGISKSTMRKLVAEGNGPKVLRISERCLGIRRRDLDSWFAERKDMLTPKN